MRNPDENTTGGGSHNLRETSYNRYQAQKKKNKRYIDYINKAADHECALLGSLGFSTAFIQSRTALSGGQISYRLRKASILRSEFRDGQSATAKALLSRVRPVAEEKLIAHLRKQNVLTPAGATNLQAAAALNGTNGNGH